MKIRFLVLIILLLFFSSIFIFAQNSGNNFFTYKDKFEISIESLGNGFLLGLNLRIRYANNNFNLWMGANIGVRF